MSVQRMTIKEAGRHFGISPDGVRQRVRRGNLESEHGDDGRVYVWVSTDVQDPDSVGERRTPVEKELRERIESLEHQLSEANTRDREHRRLLAAALERIPEIESSQESTEQRGSPETASDASDRGTTPAPEPETSQSLWQRLFGRGRSGRSG